MSIRVILVEDEEKREPKWWELNSRTKKYGIAAAIIFLNGFSVGVGHVLWPRNPDHLTQEQAARAFGIPHGYTVENTADGQLLIHTTQCANCYRPGPTVVVKFPSKKPDATNAEVDAMELISQIDKAENPKGIQIALAK